MHVPSWAEGANVALIFATVAATVAAVSFVSAGISSVLFVLLAGSLLILNILCCLTTDRTKRLISFMAMSLTFVSLTLMNYFLESRQKDFIKAKFAKKSRQLLRSQSTRI